MRILLIIATLFLFAACGNKEAEIPFTPRDTAITPVVAFTRLKLDSTGVESFLSAREFPEERTAQIRNFYNSRNYQYAWFQEEGLAEHARIFWNLHNQHLHLTRDSSFFNEPLFSRMETLMRGDSLKVFSPEDIRLTELQLSAHFFDYATAAYTGKIDPNEFQWHIPRKKLDLVSLLDSLVTGNRTEKDAWEPVNRQYGLIKDELFRYYQIRQDGGWPIVDAGNQKKFTKGDSGPAIVQLKKRLFLSGDLTATDSTDVFNEALESAVKNAQERFGLQPDGAVGPATLAAINVPLDKRIRQLLINMERIRWLPQQTATRFITVNIPDYRLYVFENGKPVLSMKVVVGKEGSRTVIFRDELKYVVFSPYWNVPSSIVRNEILPSMKKDPAYLAKNDMEQTGMSNGLPVIRQKPGRQNALGKVKFIFPNSYNIYFHDTPSRGLFQRQDRAFSHGCIRLDEPFELAKYLLQEDSTWTDDKIRKAMNAGKEKWVTLKQSLPVSITYFTAWVDGEGRVHFRDDLYGHDKNMEAHLFEKS